MIRDFRTYDAPAEDAVACDLCIAGAGAAGITLALRFVDTPIKILVLEGGGPEYEPEVQDLYAGRNVGHPYYDLDICRLRFLGGTTNHWEGWCMPLMEIDFARRPWVPHSGWPIARSDLDPYYAAAQPVVEVGAGGYDPARLPGIELLGLSPEHFGHCLYRRSPPTRFGERYRGALEAADNIEVWLNANVTEVVPDEGAGRVAAVEVAALAGGGRARVRAGAFVLALGGIETPRLLLNSNRVVAPGLGNERDLVGRFFMEHLDVFTGEVLVASREAGWVDAYGEAEREGAGGGIVWPALCLSPAAQEREGLLNLNAGLTEIFAERKASAGFASLKRLRDDVMGGSLPSGLGGHLWNIITDLDGIVAGVRESSARRLGIFTRSEQAPDPESRVRLSEERDALGLRRVALDWRLGELDRRTKRVATELIGRELGRLGVARVQIDEWLAEEGGGWPEVPLGGFHHMGTLRMADDPAAGVVDRDCRVFGLDNLYIAGSAVFPTVGNCSPTLTIVALTLRLGDHLAGRLGVAHAGTGALPALPPPPPPRGGAALDSGRPRD